MNGNHHKKWWFINQYGHSWLTIDEQTITIHHQPLTTMSLKKATTNIVLLANISSFIVKKPSFWKCGYLYVVLKTEIAKTTDQAILLSNLCIAIKRKSEFQEAQIIQDLIEKLIS